MMITKHSKRSVSLVRKFAQYLGYDEVALSHFSMGAAFHDLGKLFIPSGILLKPTRLSNKEFEVVKRHSQIGYELLSHITENDIVLNMSLYHHERWDGSGYPKGLRGEEIPIEARIMSICDVFEALTTKRAYKDSIEAEDALRIIELKLGNHFDPIIGQLFVEFIRKEAKKSLEVI